MNGRGVAVTGLGVIAPGGLDLDSFWTALCAGQSFAHRLEAMDDERFGAVRVACELNEAFAPTTHLTHPVVVAASARMEALSARNDEPERASRPFDRDRDGFVMGEGAGFVTLEAEEHVLARGGRVRARVTGYGATSDAFHLVAPHETGAGAIAAMRAALADAGLDPATVAHINAHGTSTELNDRLEALAIREVFGVDAPPVTGNKGAIGHLVGAAGAVEAVAAIRSLETGLVPPTANYETPDPEIDLDIVAGSARAVPAGPVLSNSFAFGGHNVTLILEP